jgi:signal transduction histidine kinase
MDNKEIHLECSGSFMKKDDKHLGLLVIARDITDRKKAEKELREAHNRLYSLNEELEKKVEERTAEVKKLLKQKDEFINQLGHDLKNPLNPIINLLPLINKQVYNPNLKEQLKIVMKNVDFMKNLVIKTIELAKLNSPDTEFVLEDTNLTYEINNTIEKNQLVIRDKNIEIINKINEKIIIKADKLRLNELLDNLIINSIKFCPNGGIITFDGRDNEDFITISIKDTGIGLENQQLNHIFDEFFKADKSRHDFDSSGLGLTICKRIVEKHGGTIWAESPGIGKGTTIFFTLPSYKKSDKKAIGKLNKS